MAFVHRPISADPHGQLLLQIQGAVAEYEKALLGERSRRGKLQKARAGQWVAGKAPYGYRYAPKRDGVPGHPVIDPAEAEVVRMLYGWLSDERMTVRQILERLAAGPWRPRNGQRRWSNSVVHRIPSDPTYTGTAYANRYAYRAPPKPRVRGPRAGEATCRTPRPRADWTPIPVPAIIDESTCQNASEQLARNSALSFRRNTRHTYLLRCLLTCRTCGLAMFGITQRNKAGDPAHRYYTCHGKDTVARDREHRCPQPPAEVDELDAAVWEHVRRLLDDPATLLAQFEALSGPEAGGPAGDPSAPDRWDAHLRRLDREEQRPVDAYQAEAIDLAELRDRRHQIDGRRKALAARRDRHAQLRAERRTAQQVGPDLAAFCARIRARPDDATLAERQQALQLLVERVIVGEDQVEVRHVIPLRHLKPEAVPPVPPCDGGGENRSDVADQVPEAPGVRLRSDGVGPAPLVAVARRVHVRGVPVAGHHPPLVRADQPGELVPRPPGGDAEDGGHGRDHGPQPLARAHPGLVHVGRWLAAARPSATGRNCSPTAASVAHTPAADRGTPNRSPSSRAALALLGRKAPVSRAQAARSRGPSCPSTPAGRSPQVVTPRPGQRRRCRRYSVTTGATGGSSVTWCRSGAGPRPARGRAHRRQAAGLHSRTMSGIPAKARSCSGCPGGPPGFLPDFGFGGARLTAGGSDDGGRDELVEFRLSLASRSATRAFGAAFSARMAGMNSTTAGGRPASRSGGSVRASMRTDSLHRRREHRYPSP